MKKKARRFSVRWLALEGSLRTDLVTVLHREWFNSKAEAKSFSARVERRLSFIQFADGSLSDAEINRRLRKLASNF